MIARPAAKGTAPVTADASGAGSLSGGSHVAGPDIAIGCVVWTKAKDQFGLAARGGMVVDGDDQTVTVIAEDRDWTITIRRRGSNASAKSYAKAIVRKMLLSELDLEATDPPSWSKMQGCARKMLMSAAEAVWPHGAFELCRYAQLLHEESTNL